MDGFVGGNPMNMDENLDDFGVRAPALSHITPPKVTSLHGHATSRKSHQVSKSHITSTQTAWPRVFTNMRQNEENLVNVWNSLAQMPLEYNQVAFFAH